jgi:lysine-N-methylase
MKLRELALALIGNRRYPVWERLLRFGMACEAAGRKPPAGIPALLESFGRQLDDPALDRILADTPVLTGLQLQIVRRLHDEKLPSVRVRTFQECTAAAFAGLDWPAGRPFDAAVNRRYDRAYEQFYQPFFERHGHLLENTLANYILHYDPGFQPGRIYEDYLGLVLHFAMLKTYLIGMAASEGADFSPARVVRLVCAFTKVMEPDAAFRRFALDLLAQSGCTDLLRVAVLLRN